jgi:O-antigen biosynthesis protein
MTLTYVTPTHDPKYLVDVYKSLMGQEDPEWKWIIVPNNGCLSVGSIPFDPRISIVKGPQDNDKIGAIKNFAFSLVEEGIVVELDHDDMLASNATHEIKKAFEDPAVGFVYSDSASFQEGTWDQKPYNPAYGWTYRKETVMGRELMVANNAKPGPHSVGWIYYAPNHVRAWRSEIYKDLGGHDKELSICDDHDLVCRTYLKTKMAHIEKCLYLYRVHGENSWLKRNKPIQEKTRQIFRQYIQGLALKWSKENGLESLDLGGAHGKPEGFISVDKEGGDVTWDIENGLPAEDGSVGVIRANDFLEHMKDPVKIMNEIYRVLAHGGILISNTPSTDGRGAFQDPTHVSFWNSNSFWYYTKAQYSKYVPAIKCRFSMMDVWNYFPTDFHKFHNIPYVCAIMYAIKEGPRYPGLIEI